MDVDDLALLDEATFLVNGRSRTYGHVVVDEAQDLTPMQFRMIARRAPSGSVTVLGDLAQATGAWTYGSWDEILRHLPATGAVRNDELTLGYRAPGQVLDLASKLLPVAAPTVRPTQSIRRGTRVPNILKVDRDRLAAESLAEAISLAGEDFLVGLVVPSSVLASITKLARGAERYRSARTGRHGETGHGGDRHRSEGIGVRRGGRRRAGRHRGP